MNRNSLWVFACWCGFALVSNCAVAQTSDAATWRDEVLSPPDVQAAVMPTLTLLRQDHEKLEFGRSVIQTPLRIGEQTFTSGLGTHSVSHIRIQSTQPIVQFSAQVGVDRNARTAGGAGSVVFRVTAGDAELARTDVMRSGQDTKQFIKISTAGVTAMDLHVDDGGDGPICDHADWADAIITTKDGKTWKLDELPLASGTSIRSPWPFSFLYDGKPSREILKNWVRDNKLEKIDADRTKETARWTDLQSGLRLTCETILYTDFPAAEWILYFENTGKADTKIIADVNACDVTLISPPPPQTGYRLHRTKGGVPYPTHFEYTTNSIDAAHPQHLKAGNGRSSTADFPFFKIDTRRGTAIFAVGWSGCWKADVATADSRELRVTAGLDKTHFLLHPGEKIRTPRTLLLLGTGDTWDVNARFRELIYKHYAAKRAGKPMLPMLFCNTCFTRGGGWLNECNAENQISLINAYATLGLEALLTDAGWFRGGWPNGAGNWTPREDAYPQGMGPVAAAAKAKDMIYGLWYEPERVMAGTDLQKQHPDWLLRHKAGDNETYLLNLGLPEARDYFFNIVAGFMKLPGFRFYRQDFNMDPLPYWRFTDMPDRQGITETKFIEGLYAYWDRIATTWPDSIREECASGGHRIDLETVMRMQLHQKTDYWFDNEADQGSLWGLSQYLPNSTVVAHLCRLDEYSFHSTLASSLCLGWIADDKDFDQARAKKLTARYQAVRHLLVGAWYPLLPYTRDAVQWTGSQYHRADLDEGLLLVFRRAASPYRTVGVVLRGLKPDAQYEVVSDRAGTLGTFTGNELAKQLSITLPEPHSSDLIAYRRR